MKRYEHTQFGTLTVLLVGFTLIVLVTVGMIQLMEVDSYGGGIIVLPILFAIILIGAILASFYNLTVIVDEQYLKIIFGIGLISKRFRLSDIDSVSAVRNKWYWGWGIRWYWGWNPSWYHGWLYNVSGLGGIEIVLHSGRRYRIGTDEPEKLAAAVRDIL